MLKNYIITAFRNLIKYKYYSLINILGLSIGIAGCLLMLLYVIDELSYDRFHEKADRIYRLNLDGVWGGEETRGSTSPPPLAKLMVDEFPEVQTAARIFRPGDVVVRHQNTFFTESGLLAVDPDFFNIFSFEMLEGDPKTALADPNSIVITEETAAKYFDNQPAMGKLLNIGDDKSAFKITGIVKSPPSNSHFDFDMLAPIEAYPVVKRFGWSWIWLQVVTYVVLEEGASPAAVNAKMPQLTATHGSKVIERFSGLSFDEFISTGGRWHWELQPLTDIRLYSQEVGNRLGTIGDIKTVYILSIIALFMILIACINFMNLSTARSANRIKEVGVRKALGSYRSHLIGQFLCESMLFSFISTTLALGLVELALPFFNEISGKQLAFNYLQHAWLFGSLIGLTAFVGIAAGSYPAFYLTAFQPVLALKGQRAIGADGRSSYLRKILVVCQFAISSGLIVCTLLVYQQLKFIQTKDLGFDKENVIIVNNTERLGENEDAFKQTLLQQSAVINASFCSGFPTSGTFGDFYTPEGTDQENFLLSSIKGDYEFLETMQLDLVEGRDFSEEFPTDVDGVLLNETAVKFLGWENPIGKHLIYPGNRHQRLQVLGVIKDFNFFSLHFEVQPFAIFLFTSQTYTLPVNYLSVRVQPGDVAATLEKIETQWKALAPESPFEFAFLDDRIDAQFRAEQRLGKVFGIFTGLAIFIACLGLLGLATFTAEQRTKEIGIRKVLGASAAGLMGLLLKDFARPVIIANLAAWPIAYLAMNEWLQDFAYRIDINWWTFAISGALALLIAVITIGYQAIKAALANPIKALRYE